MRAQGSRQGGMPPVARGWHPTSNGWMGGGRGAWESRRVLAGEGGAGYIRQGGGLLEYHSSSPY